MFKETQTKIILIFFIIGTIIISSLGFFYKNIYDEQIKETNETQKIEEYSERNIQIQKFTIYSLVGFGVISILSGVFISNSIVSPMKKLVKSAERIANGESLELIPTDTKRKKRKNDIDELVNAFSIMTAELKQNLNEATRQKRQIETILLHMTDGIIAFNLEGRIILINPAATRSLEIMPEDDSFDKIFSKHNDELNMEKIIYLENWTSQNTQIQVKDKYLKLLFAPFKDENERAAGIIVVIQDITEHVKLDNMRKEFIADVSHELKTPITSIMGYSDTLIESEYDKEMQTKFLGVISTEARRMAKLVTDLLSLSRFDQEQIEVKKEEFDLGALVKSCQDKLQIELDKKNIGVECFVTANVPNVYAEKDGIERVVINILTNSIKYTDENGNIKIYVGFVYNDAYIKIIDNGIGIPEDDLKRIFERFYRVDKARTRKMGGSGLGLSIAKEILDRNQGTIDIKSVYGQGTEVVIRIPTKENK